MATGDDPSLNEYFRFVRSKIKSPTCLREFRTEMVDDRTSEYGEGEIVYSLSCSCGADKLSLLGHDIENNFGNKTIRVFVSPLHVRCESCNQTRLLFDNDLHGYDAELGHGSTTLRGEGDSTLYRCRTCQSAQFRMILTFYLSSETFDMAFEDELGNSRLNERPQDLFHVISVQGTCCDCGQNETMCGLECS
ncbi:hypothetical protein Pan189_06900 [Stratiformator vulcanicus]|uniref:Uncharacterized protein n=1 Tax=Stratiformator vulcanicus TaxID=2527980 RepID=A0A517QXJ2_9PLAN|nr:hypothetical protein Pan189_06900 [Stratiformator vulcanicus]